MDYVAIFRLQLNKDPGAVLEGRFCGDSIPQSIKIEESSMTVQFISDSVANPHTGFSLHFEANFEDSKSFFNFKYIHLLDASVCNLYFNIFLLTGILL